MVRCERPAADIRPMISWRSASRRAVVCWMLISTSASCHAVCSAGSVRWALTHATTSRTNTARFSVPCTS